MDWLLILGAFALGLAIGNWVTNWAWRDHERRAAAQRRLSDWAG